MVRKGISHCERLSRKARLHSRRRISVMAAKIVRSILAVVFGVIASLLAITVVHAISERIYPPPQELVDQFLRMKEGKEMDRDKVRELMHSMPLGALWLVV